MYLCYDVRGIQSYIFQIPRLRYMVGGSALIDRFDRDIVGDLASELGVERVFSAGGRGGFRVRDEAEADRVRRGLRGHAAAIGLDLRFGLHDEFSAAANEAESLVPYLPAADELDGQPCAASGLYPVSGGAGRGGRVHPVVHARVRFEGEKLGRRFEQRLFEEDGGESCLPERLAEYEPLFFRDVSPGAGEDDLLDEALAGAAAIGRRNRWAVVCMDGNEMGAQFRAATDRWAADEIALTRRLATMSRELDLCTLAACRDGIRAALDEWLDGGDLDLRDVTIAGGAGGRERVVLPVRPLVVGGDDIVVLLHPRLAFSFVRAAADSFRERSRMAAQRNRLQGIDLWPATGDTLSISAGVLLCPVSLPLHSAIPYAESLLASAKGKGRSLRSPSGPPACIDWEPLTEGLVDHPATRRAREIRFFDEDIGEIVELTRRPYTMGELAELVALAERHRTVPRTIRHQVLTGLRAGFHDRCVFRARLAKHQTVLAGDLDEGVRPRLTPGTGRWRAFEDGQGRRGRSTDVVDALMLLEEDERMSKEAVR